MKSHVRENIVKNMINNSFQTVELDNGRKSVMFNDFGRTCIEELLMKDVTISDWVIENDGTWSVYCKEINSRVYGKTISQTIFSVNRCVDKLKRSESL